MPKKRSRLSIKKSAKEELLKFLLEYQFNQENVRKLFSFLHPAPILSSWPYCLSPRIQNSYSTTKFIILHYHLFILYKDKIDLGRWTENQSFIPFSTTNINWMSFMGKVCLRWWTRHGGECKSLPGRQVVLTFLTSENYMTFIFGKSN